MWTESRSSRRPRDARFARALVSRGCATTLKLPASTRSGARVGTLVRLAAGGRAWVAVESPSLREYCLLCLVTGPLSARDLSAQLLVWEHASGIGVVLGRQLPSLLSEPRSIPG